ncbi:MAG: asparagine synthase (glutamine-hydrolyzing) [Phycisphaerae bacterium]|nr:asparagine synthase (glutamine-hydrolyzing) [Phycisphaerae bacterium]
MERYCVCGICGYVGDHKPELLEPMCLAMAHRGPDDMGTWHDPASEIGLGHRRLSIIDLSPAGHQPMSNEDGTIWISFNGEIYDFQQHRQYLIEQGHQFRSQSDTEVLIHLYEEKGVGFLAELNGMFALAIWDGRRRQLLLARDHAGIKPVYYWQDGRRLFFASEIRALLRVPGLPRELNPQAIPDFLTFVYVPGDATMLKAIRKIEPGHYLLWRDGRVEEKQWFSMAYEPDESVPEDEWVERVHDTFMRTTRRQMVSDVPLGAFLSGGLDSSAIVACMRHSFPDREIKCYTYYYDEEDMARDQFERDFPYAQKVAQLLDVTLQSFPLRADVVSLLPKMVFSVEEPNGDQAIFASYLISKWAREDGTTVLLSGMGGDEVLFGYRSFQALRLFERLRWVPRWLLGPGLAVGTSLASAVRGAQSAIPRRLRVFRRALQGDGFQRYMALSDWSSPDIRQGLFTGEFADRLRQAEPHADFVRTYYDGFEGTGELNRRSHVLIQSFMGAHNLIYTDKSSMAVSLEVRVPYMDLELMRLCARIPERYKLKGQTTKYLLKAAMEPYLPRNVLHRSKSGFGVPLRKWVAKDLSPVIRELLSPEHTKARGLFKPEAIQRILRENHENKADHAYLIYALLVLELWLQTFVDRAGEEVTL